MKTFLKIAGAVLIILVGVIAYFAYNPVSNAGQVDNVIEASAEFYAQNRSFENFCTVPELAEAERSGFTVSCEDSVGEVSLTLSADNGIYSCQTAVGKNTDGSDTKRLACVRTDNLGALTKGTNVPTNNTASKRFDASLAISTVKDPRACTIPRFTALEQGLMQFERAIMPGVYEGSRSPTESRTFAVKKDKSVCYCAIEDGEVYVNDSGTIGQDGVITWSGNKISEFSSINGDIQVGRLPVSLVDTDSSYIVHVFQLQGGECRGGTNEWIPSDKAENAVCGCAG